MVRRLILLTAGIALPFSCGGEPTGPRGSLCDTSHGVEVCVDRAEYRSNETIEVTTLNLSDRPILKDSCGTSASPVPDSEDEFRPVYSPRRNCGVGVTREVIVDRMVQLEPGESIRETLQLGYAPQDFFRVQVWLLTPEGDLAFATPATSGVFVIFPGAGD